jgi:CubicO group peptidase (beta-lactamase class C family)
MPRLAWLLAVALVPGCGGGSPPAGPTPPPAHPLAPDTSTYFPQEAWRTALPEQVGIPSATLARVEQRMSAGSWRGLDSFLVVRRGYLVHERYFGRSSRDDVHTMQSVSKSVTSLVAGIAADSGAFDVELPVVSILPEYAGASPDPRLDRVTGRHLLEMRSGLDFYENPYPGSPLERLNNSSGDWVRIALEQPFNADPGARWQYNSGGVIALGAAVARAAATPFHVFARERLFQPLGIVGAHWILSSFDQTAHTGGGLYLRAVDLAKLGYLVLHEGRWGDRQVVSREWLARSTAPITTHPRNLGSTAVDYGLLWWLAAINPARATSEPANRVVIASGNLNQFLFVVPSLDLVVVHTGSTNESFGVTIDFVLRELIPALAP